MPVEDREFLLCLQLGGSSGDLPLTERIGVVENQEEQETQDEMMETKNPAAPLEKEQTEEEREAEQQAEEAQTATDAEAGDLAEMLNAGGAGTDETSRDVPALWEAGTQEERDRYDELVAGGMSREDASHRVWPVLPEE